MCLRDGGGGGGGGDSKHYHSHHSVWITNLDGVWPWEIRSSYSS